MNKQECTERMNALQDESKKHISEILPLLHRVKKGGMKKVKDYLRQALETAKEDLSGNGSDRKK